MRSPRISPAVSRQVPGVEFDDAFRTHRADAGAVRCARAAGVAAASSGRLPDAQRGRRDDVRRQGARPQEAGLQLLPEVRPRTADRGDGRAGRARGDDGHALRGRGAAAREQFHQVARAALQHPVPRRQELSVRLHLRRSVSAAALPSRRARPPPSLLRPVPERGRRPRRHRDCCRRCSCCAPARTRCSPTARGRACCTRSSAARRPASA